MKVYNPSGYNYVTVAEILNDEIERLNFDICKQPRETLENYYKRQAIKPKILINGGLFNMSNGNTVGTLIIDGKTYSSESALRTGFGIASSDDTRLVFGTVYGQKWRDFVNGYPVLIENGKVCPITYATEINYKAQRTVLGFNDKTIYIVCVSSPGMYFAQLQTLCLNLGMKYAINLDGGGSTRMLVNGVRKTTTIANRPVDNVFAVYTKAVEETVDYCTRTNMILNIRSGPGVNYELKGKITKGCVLHVIAEMDGTAGSASRWGKLCDGRGWIPVGAGYTTKL